MSYHVSNGTLTGLPSSTAYSPSSTLTDIRVAGQEQEVTMVMVNNAIHKVGNGFV